jgi:hypothetical protein
MNLQVCAGMFGSRVDSSCKLCNDEYFGRFDLRLALLCGSESPERVVDLTARGWHERE